jgi:hypothetical protein
VADVGGGYSVELALAPSTTGAPGTSVVILRKDGQLRYSRWTDGSYPGTLTCSPTPIANCVVVDGVGAHASQATGYRIENDELIRFDDVTSDTPVTDGIDLDGNGLIDIVTEVSTENPSYATGKRFWATLTSDGAHFSATGCSTPTFRAQPEPKQPLTGTCPQ